MTRRGRRAQPAPSPWKTPFVIGGLVVVAGAVAALAWTSSEPAGPLDLEADFSLSTSPREGSDEAPVKLFAFESPACSSCRFFHVGDGRGPSIYDRIIANEVAKGQVQYVEKTFYVGYDWERAGAYAQKCLWHTAPEKFHELTTAYYANQPRLSRETILPFVEEWANANGLDGAALAACADEERYAEEAKQDVRQGRRAGARGTPTFVIVGPTGSAQLIVGPQSYHTFQVAFSEARLA